MSDTNRELFPLVEEFYEFLQKKSIPEGFVMGRNLPRLTPKQAFKVIYILQEFLHILPDCFEQCQECLCLFDSDREGFYLSDEYELDGKPLPKKYQGHYCESCVPNIEFTTP